MAFHTKLFPGLSAPAEVIIPGSELETDVILALGLARHVKQVGLAAGGGEGVYPSVHDCRIIGARLHETASLLGNHVSALYSDLTDLAISLSRTRPDVAEITETSYYAGLHLPGRHSHDIPHGTP